MKIAKLLIVTGLACMAYILAKAEAVTQHYDACEVHRNGVSYAAVKCRVIGDSARIVEAKTGRTRILLGGVQITADNSLPPCVE